MEAALGLGGNLLEFLIGAGRNISWKKYITTTIAGSPSVPKNTLSKNLLEKGKNLIPCGLAFMVAEH